MKKLAILNSPIITNDGGYEVASFDLELAKKLLVEDYKGNYESFIGHQSTAKVVSALLGIEIEANRGTYSQEAETDALIFKLNGRVPEGKILSIEEIEEIGYSFKVITRTY
jgi:hypothetical protein